MAETTQSLAAEATLISDASTLLTNGSTYHPGVDPAKDAVLCRRINKLVADKVAAAHHVATPTSFGKVGQSPLSGPAALLHSWTADIDSAAGEPTVPAEIDLDPSIMALTRKLSSSVPEYSGQHYSADQLQEHYKLALQLLSRDLVPLQTSLAHVNEVRKKATEEGQPHALWTLLNTGSYRVESIARHAVSHDSVIKTLSKPAYDDLRQSMLLLRSDLKDSAKYLEDLTRDAWRPKSTLGHDAMSWEHREGDWTASSAWVCLREHARLAEQSLSDALTWHELTAAGLKAREASLSELDELYRPLIAP